MKSRLIKINDYQYVNCSKIAYVSQVSTTLVHLYLDNNYIELKDTLEEVVERINKQLDSEGCDTNES